MYNFLQDTPFLKELAQEQNKTIYAKILILDRQEMSISSIEGRITQGSLNINGSSSTRRTGSLTFVVDKDDDIQLTDVNSLLSITRKIQIFVGVENNINTIYDTIIWFPLGIFVITQPNISNSLSGINIQLTFQDKMCLLNGTCGGALPASVIFDSYDQIIGSQVVNNWPDERNDYTVYILKKSGQPDTYWRWNIESGWVEGTKDWIDERNGIVGKPESKKNLIFDIIQTLLINYGNENPAKILINDIPLETKQLVRFTGAGTLYYNPHNFIYSLTTPLDDDTPPDEEAPKIEEFYYNEDVGYVYTDFTYPGELVSGIGESITSVLDKIKEMLGNYEYFYDINGNFVFQEIKNYLNKSYSSTILDQAAKTAQILGVDNYKADFNNSPQSVFTFEEGGALISSYSNTPSYTNIKNDYHIWGKNDDGRVIHYHLAIKKPPQEFHQYWVVFGKNEDGEYDGTLKLATAKDFGIENIVVGEHYITNANEFVIATPSEMAKVIDDYRIEKETLFLTEGEPKLYTPEDWRAELYLQGLLKKSQGLRPDIYESEILDYLDLIYDFYNKQYKVDIINNPNLLTYFIDYLEPVEHLHDCSVDVIGPKIHSYQQDKVNKIYSNPDVPNLIIVNIGFNDKTQKEIREKCEAQGQSVANVDPTLYKSLAIGTSGYSAQDTVREMLYQYTHYNEQISIQSIPLYFLDANTRISVYDKVSNIHGDYIIKSISVPLTNSGAMSITAQRAQERI